MHNPTINKLIIKKHDVILGSDKVQQVDNSGLLNS